jgi:hypothetical protein
VLSECVAPSSFARPGAVKPVDGAMGAQPAARAARSRQPDAARPEYRDGLSGRGFKIFEEARRRLDAAAERAEHPDIRFRSTFTALLLWTTEYVAKLPCPKNGVTIGRCTGAAAFRPICSMNKSSNGAE